MSFRRALALAACGLAGGSVLFSAVAVGKPPARSGGGDAEPRPGAAAAVPAAPAAPQGLLLLPPAAASCPPAAGWIERAGGTGGYWDSNWDRWAAGGAGGSGGVGGTWGAPLGAGLGRPRGSGGSVRGCGLSLGSPRCRGYRPGEAPGRLRCDRGEAELEH